MAAMRLPLWLKLVWTMWVVAWAPVYWKHYEAQNFLYFCDCSYSKVSTPSICWERS